jgi:hypothetical protein
MSSTVASAPTGFAADATRSGEVVDAFLDAATKKQR